MNGKARVMGVVAAVLWCAPLGAQETFVTPLEPGVQSLSFAVFGSGSGSFGYWKMRTERVNVGWEVRVSGSHSGDTAESEQERRDGSFSNAGISVGPSFRRYWGADARVLPFFQSGIQVGYVFGSQERESSLNQHAEFTDHGISLGGQLGLGVEWFPTARVSVSGFTGAGAGTSYLWSHGEGVDSRGKTESGSSRWNISAGTFTSSLAFRIYLPPGSKLFP